jgi:hypothetical protein
VITFVNSINRFVFVTETEHVPCEVRTQIISIREVEQKFVHSNVGLLARSQSALRNFVIMNFYQHPRLFCADGLLIQTDIYTVIQGCK